VRITVLDPGAPAGPLEGDVVVVPHGLGDAASEARGALRDFVGRGGRVLGLGDGVALLCAAELLPGSVAATPAPTTHVRVEGRATPFTWAIPAGRILALGGGPAHRYTAPAGDVAALSAGGRILLRYCDASGGVTASPEPASTVAGLSDDSGRVVGILGGVSQALDCALGSQIRRCLDSARASGQARSTSAPA
jgi:phosphoribosylformylglycinamidine (FGAM) synthase-like amidotransferase family enzyme